MIRCPGSQSRPHKAAKSGHMTFVHSCGTLGLLLSGHVFDCGCDLRSSIEMGELVLPWPVCLHVPLDILHQVTEAFPFMVPRALIMHISEHPLNRVGTWTVGW